MKSFSLCGLRATTAASLRTVRRALVGAALGASLLGPSAAQAATEIHLLRVDPRAASEDGTPVLSTVIEIGQPRSVADVTANCGSLTGKAMSACYADAVEAPNSLWQPFNLPDSSTQLLVNVEGADTPATFISKTQWSEASKKKGVGTAWLLALDCASSMGNRYSEGRQVVVKFLEQMGPNDMVRLFLFDDRDNAFTGDSKWQSYAKRNAVMDLLNKNPGNAPSGGSSRALFNTVKNMITSGFNDLTGAANTDSIPIHQAFVLLSNGAGRQDALSNAAGGEQLKKYATDGRMDGNTTNPKTPLPIISILLPNSTAALTNKMMANNDVQFMQSLANPEVGGFFSVVADGEGAQRGGGIAKAVKTRFNSMWLVKWKLSCLNPTATQSFNLLVNNSKQVVKPDGSFKDVPLGIDPSEWPLDINVAATRQEAQNNPLHPGGSFKVYGTFCWGGDKQRAESYFIPTGMQVDPNAKNGGIAAARQMMQNLIAQGMRGSATDTNATFVTFDIPDDDKLLEGSGENTVARVVVFDNRANRASSLDAETVLTLKAQKKPFNILLIGGIVGGVIIVGLLVAVLLRSGGNNKRRGGGGGPPPPAGGGGYPNAYMPPGGQQGGYGGPPAGGGYAPPGGGYGGPPPGGGYGASGYNAAAVEAQPLVIEVPQAMVEMGKAEVSPLAPSFPAHRGARHAAGSAARQSLRGQAS